MVVPVVSQPGAPDCGAGWNEGGLVRWSWAEQRQLGTNDFWVSTVCPAGGQHLGPGWEFWDGEALWLSVSAPVHDPRAGSRASRAAWAPWRPAARRGGGGVDRINVKSYRSEEAGEPEGSTRLRVRLRYVFGADAAELGAAPTRWGFDL